VAASASAGGSVPAHLRNAFLDLIESEREGPEACGLAARLLESTDVLPYEHCDMLDLPVGSTFGQAAHAFRLMLGCHP
jgi:hypothetical protein